MHLGNYVFLAYKSQKCIIKQSQVSLVYKCTPHQWLKTVTLVFFPKPVSDRAQLGTSHSGWFMQLPSEGRWSWGGTENLPLISGT